MDCTNRTITLKKRVIPLAFTSQEMLDIQLEITTPFRDAIAIVLGRNPKDKSDSSKMGSNEHLNAAAKMIRILGNAGLEESGQEADLTDKKVLRLMHPSEVAEIVNICIDVIGEAMNEKPSEGQPEDPENKPATDEK